VNKPIAIVISWFGRELKGGAEQLAWQVAARLADRGHRVEVLTTCCRSFLDDWSHNHLAPGENVEGKVLIRRFPVERRAAEEFAAANNFVLSLPVQNLLPGVSPFTCGTADTFIYENIKSGKLLRFLKKHKDDYHAFIFLPYLYGPVLNGLPLVADKAFLQPCLHDEAYAYLPRVEELFRMARGILYNSAGEARLARRLYGPGIQNKEVVVGVGVETTDGVLSDIGQVGPIFMEKDRFILCLGRRDVHKNTLFLAEAFTRFKKNHPESSLKLALAGPGDTSFSDIHPDVVDLGLVSEQEKEALLANCVALFHPSENESYSRVIMEAWFHERPVAAHRHCLATAMAVQTAGGGWLAGDDDEWVDLLTEVDTLTEGDLHTLGMRGKSYAGKYAVWDRVIDRYEKVLGLTGQADVPVGSTRVKGKAVHQLLPGFAFGDAISNQAMLIRDYLRGQGYESVIYTEAIDPSMTHEAELFAEGKLPADAAVIYHHSIGSGLLDFLSSLQGPRCLIYHNITPPEFVADHDPALAGQLQQGLDMLPRLAELFPVSVGVSGFNAEELRQHGFVNPDIMPICVDPAKWNIPAPVNRMFELQDGRTNILFVGRIVSNKCQHDLIEAFSLYRRFDPGARLFLIGGYDDKDPYYKKLVKIIDSHGLSGDVFFAGKVDDAHLHAYFRTAHLYWSMSEHEGFGVPFIEAMWFDVPVLAYKSSAIPETLGQGGILFDSKEQAEEVAALAHLLVHNDNLRENVLAVQAERRIDFLPDQVLPVLDRLLSRMEATA
jgi:glycosyltransferase involved in cell wall biosynthesis